MKRLNKYLAECGIDSRRKCDVLIDKGCVQVNGQTIRSHGTVIDESKDEIKVNGKTVQPPKHFTYILLNKPKGYVTTVDDEFNRKKVVDLIRKKERLFPVGRLDKDTSGALLLTNDGDIAYKLTHPKFEITKEYVVVLKSPFTSEDFSKLKSGVMLEDGLAKPKQISINKNNKKLVKLVLTEGRKREIRRMFKSLGYLIKELKRLRFAGISIMGLHPGQWRNLTEQEVNHLKRIVKS